MANPMRLPIFQSALCLVLTVALSGEASATIISILPGDFAPGATVIDFETGTTALPSVPGVTFVDEGNPMSPPWFDGSGNFEGFFGNQGWSNLISATYSDLALEFATPVQAVGAWVGRIPNFANEHPPQVDVELFDAQDVSLGSDSISLPMAFDTPVFFGFTADAPIARLEIRGNNMGFFSADNVTIGNLAAVPEPASLALCGIVSLALLRRRQRRRPERSR